jgi:folate-binding protein YgfZ
MSAVLVEEGPDRGAIWHFGEPNHEQRALEAGTAVADLSHRAVISISGDDRLTWLNDLATQEFASLQPGQWVESLMLDAQGHITQQFYAVDDGERVWIHTEAEKEDALLTFLKRMVFMLKVDPQSATATHAVVRAPGLHDGIGGPYAIVPRAELVEVLAAFATVHTQVGTWALEAERVAAHRARILFETDHKSIPNELGFLNGAVHMKKGCYPGQETVAKVFNLGHPPRRLVLLHLDGSMVHYPATGAKVFSGEKEVGYIGTLARHFELGPIALAVIRRTTPVSDVLTVDGVPATQEIIVAAE